MGVDYQNSLKISKWEAKIFLEENLISFLNSLPFKNMEDYKKVLSGNNSIYKYLKVYRNFKNFEIKLVRILEKNNYKITSYETLVFLKLIFLDEDILNRLTKLIVSDNIKDPDTVKFKKLKLDYIKRRIQKT